MFKTGLLGSFAELWAEIESKRATPKQWDWRNNIIDLTLSGMIYASYRSVITQLFLFYLRKWFSAFAIHCLS